MNPESKGRRFLSFPASSDEAQLSSVPGYQDKSRYSATMVKGEKRAELGSLTEVKRKEIISINMERYPLFSNMV